LLSTDLNRRSLRIGERTIAEGELISIDGNDGAIYPGRLTVVTERPERELAAIRSWRTAGEFEHPRRSVKAHG
jgi:pyruvate,orthophosphate dikinase